MEKSDSPDLKIATTRNQIGTDFPFRREAM